MGSQSGVREIQRRLVSPKRGNKIDTDQNKNLYSTIVRFWLKIESQGVVWQHKPQTLSSGSCRERMSQVWQGDKNCKENNEQF